MTTKQKQLIKDLYREVSYTKKELIKEAFPEMFERPNTGWFKHILGAIIFRTAEKCGYGIDSCGDWQTFDSWSFVSQPDNWQPAPEEEVKEMLIKEAKRRGVWDCPIIDANGKKSTHEKAIVVYAKEENILWGKFGRVFHNGKWATPLAQCETETIHLFGNMYKISLIN